MCGEGVRRCDRRYSSCDALWRMSVLAHSPLTNVLFAEAPIQAHWPDHHELHHHGCGVVCPMAAQATISDRHVVGVSAGSPLPPHADSITNVTR